ncbi:hypothetical protein RvY_12105 [Ramazzottius varieornatus]|uniref:Uncharacterized protein n=1 Tax=Ramazzottius varieornatus TaxID=947166 RepID=A0A1D1VMM2_RAMVA|nr:hypothetical protein RvY_12105 [Ramazzottius varieornatus]
MGLESDLDDLRRTHATHLRVYKYQLKRFAKPQLQMHFIDACSPLSIDDSSLHDVVYESSTIWTSATTGVCAGE